MEHGRIHCLKPAKIGDMMEISQIRKTLQNIDDDFKVMEHGNSITGLKEQWFLTEDGLYELLSISRKPLAKEFRKHVRAMLKQQRLQLGAQQLLNNQLDNQLVTDLAVAKTKEEFLVEKHKGKSGLYFLINHIMKKVKFGSSHDVTKRLVAHKRAFGEQTVFLDKVIETTEYARAESLVRPLRNSTMVDLGGHSHTEIIEYTDRENLASAYQNIDNSMLQIEPPSYHPEVEVERQKTTQQELVLRQRELELKIALVTIENEKRANLTNSL